MAGAQPLLAAGRVDARLRKRGARRPDVVKHTSVSFCPGEGAADRPPLILCLRGQIEEKRGSENLSPGAPPPPALRTNTAN